MAESDEKKEFNKDNKTIGLREKIASGLCSLLDSADNIIGNNVERQSRKRIYLNIAQFIQKQSEGDLALCLSATYLLCGEDDKELLRKNPRSQKAEKIAELAKQHILTIKVHYEKIDMQNNYLCQTEIYYIKNGVPVAYRAQEQIVWEDMPDKAREQVIKTGKKVIMQLFPQKAHVS